MGYSYTHDDPDDMVILAVLRALDGRPSPYRVVVMELDTQAWTHTLREGGFPTRRGALQWCMDRIAGASGPLPPVRPATPCLRPGTAAPAAGSHPPGRGR
ncbi:hypothetical protein [Streptomyces iconiensis]|uniref:hypothetical protein n=1 Tax=Streptomyces iconiensis TaxID=1384038 RepID=UPI003219DF95